MQTIAVKRLAHSKGLDLPSYETAGAAAMDIRAACPESDPIRIPPGKRALVPTGLCFAVPHGFMVQVCPRSGMSLRNGVLCSAPGIIDADYRGEVQIILFNHDDDRYFVVERGDRIAQLLIVPAFRAAWNEVAELSETVRGEGGFGSTGNV
jgi:dUTP pyrophosphatase